MARWFSIGMLLGIVLVLGTLFYQVMIGFLLPLFLATILVIIFGPVFRWILGRFGGRRRLAALATTGLIVAAVLVPLISVVTLAAFEARSLVAQLKNREIRQRIAQLRIKLGLDYDDAEQVRFLEASLATLQIDARRGAAANGNPAAARRIVETVDDLARQVTERGRTDLRIESLLEAATAFEALALDPDRSGTLAYSRALEGLSAALRRFKSDLLGNDVRAWLKELAHPTEEELAHHTERVFAGVPGILRSVGGATTQIVAKTILGIVITILAVYFFFADGPVILETFLRLSPLDDQQEQELLVDFNRISRAVVVATLLSAVVQGILAAIGFQVAGVGSVFLLMLATIAFALIPFFGAATVWIPVCLWLYFSEGRIQAAVLLAIYGGGVVSVSDNIIKPLVLHGEANLHPLLALLSVLGGVTALGPIGVLIGPMTVVFLQTFWNMLQRQFSSLDQVA